MRPPAHPLDAAVARALQTLVPGRASVLVGCSGGADSVALVAALARAGVPVSIGHVDHGLRAESGREAAHVHALARLLGLPFFIECIEGLSIADGGLERVAREARYPALLRLAKSAGTAVVAVAHTRRDVAETLLLRLARGAGPGALAGPRASRPLSPEVLLVRPLLDVSREDTESYCREHGLAFVVDPTNADPGRGRGRIRGAWEVLRGLNPRLEESLAGAARLFADDDAFLESLAEAELREGTAGLECARLAQLHPALLRRVLLRSANESGARPERRHLEMLRDLLLHAGSLDLPGGRAVSDGTLLRYEPRSKVPEPPPGEVAIGGPGRYAWGSRALAIAPGSNGGLCVDLVRAPFPWTLRARRAGDRFRPGRGHVKKVSDLWIDAGVARERRAGLALLQDANGILFWVEGLRPGEACCGEKNSPVSFRFRAEMGSAVGAFGEVRRVDSASATMASEPVEEPR